jgi:hypothetical protein
MKDRCDVFIEDLRTVLIEEIHSSNNNSSYNATRG